MSNHVIMGTAGHVDHGKTTLVKALTGFDCDTHKEEKKRGITINLGFTHIMEPNGSQIGIIDVPGHKDFIKTMIAGAGGIDFVLLVVAADSGIMPQTQEHLKILEMLGVKNGIIALTKADLIEPLLVELAEEEIEGFVKGTFLENAPIIQVSALKNINIEKLKGIIFQTAQACKKSQEEIYSPFRMYIDRIFSPPGIGTVITGSAINGQLDIKDKVYVIPTAHAKHDYRIKNIQKYGDNSDIIHEGERAAININGFKKDDFKRGMLISNSMLTETKMVDARIDLFKKDNTNTHEKIFRNNYPWLHTIFYIGTLETKSKIHILDLNISESKDYFFAQIHLDTPCICRFGDKFVIRNSSGNDTLGGGMIIDSSPLHHKRRSGKIIEDLNNINNKGFCELLKLEVNKNFGITSTTELVSKTNYSSSEINNNLPIDDGSVISIFIEDNDNILINKKIYNSINKELIKIIGKHHKSLPLSNNGLSLNELEHRLKLESYNSGIKILSHLLALNEKSGKLKHIGKTWALSDHNVRIDRKLKENINFVDSILKNSGMTVPLMKSIIAECKAKMNISADSLDQILKHLVGTNRVYRVEDSYLHAEIVDKCRQQLIDYLKCHTDGITVAQFRDIVDGNRKICLLLLNIFDKEKTTARDANNRHLHQNFIKINEVG